MTIRKAWEFPLPVRQRAENAELGATATPPRRVRLSPHLLVGGGLLAVMVLAALLAPLIAPVPPEQVRASLQFQPPGGGALFGTDQYGRDQFSRVVWGARLALELGLLSTLIGLLPGVLLGLLAGYFDGWVDEMLSRLMDAWLALPGLLLAIILVAKLGPSLETTIFALGVTGIPGFFRIARNSALSLRKMQFVEAARSLGATDARIILRHILPNLSSPLVVMATLRMGTALLAGAGLSFIGLGAQPPAPEWGSLLASGREFMDSAWWLAVFPGLAITLAVMGFNLLGDGLRDVMAREN